MTKDEAAKHCIKCLKCTFEAIYDVGLTPGVNDDCLYAKAWLKETHPQYATKLKHFRVYYAAKFNGTQKDYFLRIDAKNAKEARDLCRRMVQEKTGRHAFTIKSMLSEKLPKGYQKVEEGYPPSK